MLRRAIASMRRLETSMQTGKANSFLGKAVMRKGKAGKQRKGNNSLGKTTGRQMGFNSCIIWFTSLLMFFPGYDAMLYQQLIPGKYFEPLDHLWQHGKKEW
jgi:hypothetical protein